MREQELRIRTKQIINIMSITKIWVHAHGDVMLMYHKDRPSLKLWLQTQQLQLRHRAQASVEQQRKWPPSQQQVQGPRK